MSEIILHGDCLNIIKTMTDNSVQLIITSPPYNLNKEYEKSSTLEDYLSTFNTLMDEMVRVLDDRG